MCDKILSVMTQRATNRKNRVTVALIYQMSKSHARFELLKRSKRRKEEKCSSCSERQRFKLDGLIRCFDMASKLCYYIAQQMWAM